MATDNKLARTSDGRPGRSVATLATERERERERESGSGDPDRCEAPGAVSLGIKCGTSSVGAAWSADSADQGVAVISPGLTPQTLRGTSLHPEMQSTKCF